MAGLSKRQPLQPARARVWFRRALLLASLSLVLVAQFYWLGITLLWVGVLSAFAGAEITRRIVAEQHPDMPYGWIDILKGLQRTRSQPAHEPRGTVQERRRSV